MVQVLWTAGTACRDHCHQGYVIAVVTRITKDIFIFSDLYIHSCTSYSYIYRCKEAHTPYICTYKIYYIISRLFTITRYWCWFSYHPRIFY